ncbi:DUF5916 domain-containing protein [Luteimonas salinilitoris]|uniref:DUF5916 domain-containing protein n=1 Tax=Luteimonas salinilitoris TaxID=3237697 RepID=A0ABV4HNL1_9GAMM
MPNLSIVAIACLFACPALANAALVIDGRPDEAEWENAHRYADFRVVVPYTLGEPTLPTEALLLSTPDGIAVAFINTHPPEVPRLKPRLERDQSRASDHVNFIIDFDGDGRVGYGYSVLLSGSIADYVVTNETSFNYDWNGDWRSAVHETDEGWTVEMLIPWSAVAMRGSDTPSRLVKVHFDRVLGTTRERSGAPPAAASRGRFVSDFAPLEIPQYRRASFHVFPYLTAQQDFVDDDRDYKLGADLFWKPSAGFQLSAALNPDFGQVEADELVVNFDAIETLFTDRRPFFTENQGFFDLHTPDDGQLIYTRRIGGASDDGSGRAADIDAALKVNGSFGSLGYGALAAQEADDAGRSFYAARLLRSLGPALSVGWLGTYAERPALDRDANVQTFDLSLRPGPQWRVDAQLLASAVKTGEVSTRGDGAWARVKWTPTDGWQHEVEALHFGRDLDFNDMGYQRRPGLNQLQATTEYVHRAAAGNARLRATRWRAKAQARSNDDGEALPGVLRLTQTSDFRSGASLQFDLTLESAGIDDLISRGNGDWERPARQRLIVTHRTPVQRHWQLRSELHVFEAGLGGTAVGEKFMLDWFPRDDFNLQLRVEPLHPGDWLVWERGREFGRYRRRMHIYGVDANWFPGRKHEFRLKAQWLAVDAREGRGYRLEGGTLAATGERLPDFAVNSFGLQLRYRYEFAPRSDLYLVYSRGGTLTTEGDPQSSFDLLEEALQLRDADQFLAKLRFRF